MSWFFCHKLISARVLLLYPNLGRRSSSHFSSSSCHKLMSCSWDSCHKRHKLFLALFAAAACARLVAATWAISAFVVGRRRKMAGIRDLLCGGGDLACAPACRHGDGAARRARRVRAPAEPAAAWTVGAFPAFGMVRRQDHWNRALVDGRLLLAGCCTCSMLGVVFLSALFFPAACCSWRAFSCPFPFPAHHHHLFPAFSMVFAPCRHLYCLLFAPASSFARFCRMSVARARRWYMPTCIIMSNVMSKRMRTFPCPPPAMSSSAVSICACIVYDMVPLFFLFDLPARAYLGGAKARRPTGGVMYFRARATILRV